VEHEPEVEQDHSVGGLCPGIQLNAHAFWYWEEPLWVHIRKVDCPLCKGHIVVVPETVRYEGSRSMQGSYFVTFHMASLAYETRVDYVSDINTHTLEICIPAGSGSKTATSRLALSRH
jgi:hypothetical protein